MGTLPEYTRWSGDWYMKNCRAPKTTSLTIESTNPGHKISYDSYGTHNMATSPVSHRWSPDVTSGPSVVVKSFENNTIFTRHAASGFLSDVSMAYWNIITSISEVSEAFIDNYTEFMQQINICSVDPSFFQDLCNSSWHIVNQLLDQILTDGNLFLHNQCLEFVRICRFLFVHPPPEDWPQILNWIKIWGVSWPWTQNLSFVLWAI